jgi:hypothetical protein
MSGALWVRENARLAPDAANHVSVAAANGAADSWHGDAIAFHAFCKLISPTRHVPSGSLWKPRGRCEYGIQLAERQAASLGAVLAYRQSFDSSFTTTGGKTIASRHVNTLNRFRRTSVARLLMT